MANIHPTAIIDKRAKIGRNVSIGPYCVIDGPVVIGDNCQLYNHVSIMGNTAISHDCIFWPFSSIGGDPQDLKFQQEDSILEIGHHCTFRECCTINKGTQLGGNITKIGNHCLIMSCCHIAHDCIVGDNVIMASFSGLSGHAQVGNYVTLSAYAVVHQRIKIGDYTLVGSTAKVNMDVVPFVIVAGENKAKVFKINLVRLQRCKIAQADITIIKDLFKIFFRSKNTTDQALKIIQSRYPQNHYALKFVDFIINSNNGIIH